MIVASMILPLTRFDKLAKGKNYERVRRVSKKDILIFSVSQDMTPWDMTVPTPMIQGIRRRRACPRPFSPITTNKGREENSWGLYAR